MKKQLLTGLACLTVSTVAWAVSTQITFNDIMISTGHNSVELNPNASVDKGARSYLGGYSTSMGSSPFITAVNSGTGVAYWSNTQTDVSGDFQQLALIGGTVCAGGRAADDNGDGGDNVVIACYQASKGTLLWKKEFENPTDGSTNLQFMKLSGSKNLLVWVYDTDSSDTIVLSINPKTGAITQNNPI